MRRQSKFSLDEEFLRGFHSVLRVPKEVAVVGAGRWGKIICNVLAQFTPPISKIHLVAERNYSQAENWLRENLSNSRENSGYERIVLSESLQEILQETSIEAAFVTKMAGQHYTATRQLLLHGKHVFVEKPFVLHKYQAEDLAQLAAERDRTLVVGHEYMLARHIHYLSALVEERLVDISSIELLWEAPATEEKWGIRKQLDLSANVIIDLYPHILSQVSVLLGKQQISLTNVRSKDACWQARLELLYGSTPVIVSLDKSAKTAKRSIAVTSSKGEVLVLDYTKEPGELRLNGALLPQDPLWDLFPSPLSGEMAYFFAQIEAPDRELPTTGENSIYIVEATELANSKIVDLQNEVMRDWLLQDLPATPPENVLLILRHHLVCPLLDHGLINDPKDIPVLDSWLAKVAAIVHQFSSAPWTTQEEILERNGLSRPELIQLNGAIRESDFLQRLILHEGIGQKYWNTILPLVKSGALHAVLNGNHRFPLRVSIFPGLSCMFYCGFCGRNYSAKYPGSAIESGNELLERIFADMPGDGQVGFSFSGGMEPLTNPGLGDLISTATKHGIEVPLITNGYMLTPSYVARHEGLWDLNSLRVSLYGVDEGSYYNVTKRKGAFKLVKQNVIEFLKLRNEKGSQVKFGLNYIVLLGSTDQILPLLELIVEINSAVGGSRGIDFLTIREDFSVTEMEGLSPHDRGHLIELFSEFNSRRERECPDLHVDFGYSMAALGQGKIGMPLMRVDHKGMRPSVYPQISVVVDLFGDVYLYHEAGFLDRPGADRYKMGTVTKTRSLETVVREFVESGREIEPLPTDPEMLDAFDHIVTVVLNQAELDEEIGIPFDQGPVLARRYDVNEHRKQGRNRAPIHTWYEEPGVDSGANRLH
jgi:dTDP-4-amino-4,6-dideoxy-D-glucose ammonia-lyase